MSNLKYIVIVLVLVVVGWYFVTADKKEVLNDNMVATSTPEQVSPVTQEMPVSGSENVPEMLVEKDVDNTAMGSFEVYAPEKLAKADSGKVVLYFRAAWCPTCKALDANIRANLDKIPAGVTILDVDYDKYNDLKKKYNVTYQHTLVQVDASGNQIKKWSGSPTLDSILGNL